jgi:hypothetical protein
MTSGIIDPTAPPAPWSHLLNVDGQVIAEHNTVKRMRFIRLGPDGEPTDEGVEVDCRSMVVRRPPEPPSPCVPLDTSLRRYIGTLDLELL